MDSLAEQLQRLCPPTFKIANVIRLNETSWQVNISDDNGVIVATGDTIELALDASCEKATNHEYIGRFRLDDAQITKISLIELLGLKKAPILNFKRRV